MAAVRFKSCQPDHRNTVGAAISDEIGLHNVRPDEKLSQIVTSDFSCHRTRVRTRQSPVPGFWCTAGAGNVELVDYHYKGEIDG
jgi:hypothetical protein